MNRNSKRTIPIFRILLAMLCIIGIGVSGFKIIGYIKEQRDFDESEKVIDDHVSEKAEQTITVPDVHIDGDTEEISQFSYKELDIDFESLKALNPDIVGWIHIPDTVISYPIVKGKDNVHYLSRDALDKKSDHGAIFMDSSNNIDFSDMKTIIYGHRMNDGSMFGQLNKYSSGDYCKKHSVGFLYTPEKTYTFLVVGAGEINAESDYYRTYHSKGKEYADDISALLKASEIKSSYIWTEDQKTLVLSTCIRHKSDKRFILVCILMEGLE